MKLLTVIGATGMQGSSVVNEMLQHHDQWKIRALTRTPSSEAAKALQAKGVQVVKADLNDAASLNAAFADSYAFFATTDFFAPFAASNADAATAIDIEWQQAHNILQAASNTTSLKHFIWSTLPDAAKVSNGKYRIPHFEAKNRAEDYIKADPKLWAKTTFLWVGWYAGNFQYPIFKPTMLVSACNSFRCVAVRILTFAGIFRHVRSTCACPCRYTDSINR